MRNTASTDHQYVSSSSDRDVEEPTLFLDLSELLIWRVIEIYRRYRSGNTACDDYDTGR
jgi:hypothetical protein